LTAYAVKGVWLDKALPSFAASGETITLDKERVPLEGGVAGGRDVAIKGIDGVGGGVVLRTGAPVNQLGGESCCRVGGGTLSPSSIGF
jgi:hypothetical protein